MIWLQLNKTRNKIWALKAILSQFQFLLYLFVWVNFVICFQAWLKKAEDQASAILLDAKNIQRAQDKLLIHKVCVLLCKEI